MVRNIVRIVVLLIFAVAINVTPVFTRGHLPFDPALVHMPGFFIALYLEALGIADVSDWRGDLTDHGEAVAFIASVVFWWFILAGAFVLISGLRRNRRLTSR